MKHYLSDFDIMRFNDILKNYAKYANKFLFHKIDRMEVYFDIVSDNIIIIVLFKNGYKCKKELGSVSNKYDFYLKKIRHFIENRENKLKDIYDKNQALLNLKSDDPEIREFCRYILQET